MRIAVDAMGGDLAPEEIVHGVALAIEAEHVSAGEVVVVGDFAKLESLREEISALAEVEFRHASQQIEMCDRATLRSKPDSSIAVAMRMVKEGAAQAFISAGNTGAVVATAITTLGRIQSVKRPGIGVTFNSATGPVMLVDVGANMHCTPQHLLDYGRMASVVSRDLIGVASPKVALLNIGEEDGKGNDLVRDTREMFEESDLNFVGNIEGNELYSGRCDVVVCEGFVGNVVLKCTEGMGTLLIKAIHEETAGLDDPGSLRGLRHIASKLDYAEYGGAPLLGVDGQVMIMHGRSKRRAMASALRVARQYMVAGVTDHIRDVFSSGDESGEGGER